MENQLSNLPEVQKAIQRPTSEFREIAREFLKYAKYCSFIASEKFRDWCNFMQCSQGGICLRNENGDFTSQKVNSTQILNTITDGVPDYCFDIWFCSPSWLATTNHYIFGIFGIFILLIALVSTVIYTPSFTYYGSFHGTEILLTVLALSDAVNIFLIILLEFIPFTQFQYQHQTDLYSNIVAPIVPFLDPLKQLVHNFSFFILILLLYDEYLLQYYGKYAKMVFNKKSTLIYLLVIFVVLFSFNSMKLFQFYCKRNWNDKYRVYLTLLGQNPTFYGLMTHWLKVPMEYFAPLLALFILLTAIFYKLSEQIPKSSKSQINKRKISIAEKSIKDFILIDKTEREMKIRIGLILICLNALLIKFLELVYHILRTENSKMTWDSIYTVKMVSMVFTIELLLFKPIFYFILSPLYLKHCNFCRGDSNNRNNSTENDLHNEQCFEMSNCNHNEDEKEHVKSFERSMTDKMRESISYRQSIIESNKKPEAIQISLASDVLTEDLKSLEEIQNFDDYDNNSNC